MDLVKEKIQNEFRFDLDEFLENYPLYSQKGSAVRSLRKKFIQGVDFVEVLDGNRKRYKMTWRCIQRLFFRNGMEVYGEVIDSFIGDLAEYINDLEAMSRRLQTLVDESTLTLIKNVPPYPIKEILRKHGRDSIKEFMSQNFDGLTTEELATLKQAWEVLGDFAERHPEISHPLVTVLSFFTNPGMLQEELKKVATKKSDLHPEVEQQRKEWRLRKKRQRDRAKAQRIA